METLGVRTGVGGRGSINYMLLYVLGFIAFPINVTVPPCRTRIHLVHANIHQEK